MVATPREALTRDQVPDSEKWDLTSIYPSDTEWESDLNRIGGLVDVAAAYRGSLGESAETLFGALDASTAAEKILERVVVYAHLRRDEDHANPVWQSGYDRAVRAAIEGSQKLAFFQPELLQIPESTFDAFVADPALADYQHVLEDAGRRRAHTRSIEIEELLAQSLDIARTAGESFNALNDADLTFGTVKDDQGNEVVLTRSRAQLLLESKNRDVRRDAYAGLIGAYKDHLNTVATLHGSSVRKDVFYARARNYPSARASALFNSNVPEAVYDNLVATVRGAQDPIKRYLGLRQGLLGVDQLALYDLYVPLSPAPERMFTPEEAVQVVLQGVSPLGDTYVNDLDHLFKSRIVDWQETKGKDSGAYSSSTYDANPVILMNWNGTTDHVFTLAHEAGHAMHSFYAMANQPYQYYQYSIFGAEIASTVNEVLLTWDLLRQTPEENVLERFAILNRFADSIWGTLFRQTMFAEFEHLTHQAAEAGAPLTAETISDIYGGLADVYRPGVENEEASRIEWSRVPHFYRAFYVYQYATGISSALALASKIRDEGEEARERYLGMLKAGGSDYPIVLLEQAGVDLTTPEPIEKAVAVFDDAVAEMEAISNSDAFTNPVFGN